MLIELKNIPFHYLSTISIQFVKEFEKRDSKDKRILLNPRTIQRKAYSVQGFYNFLIHEYDYPKNPLFYFKAPKTPKKSDTQDFKLIEIETLFGMLKEDKIDGDYLSNRNDLMTRIAYKFALRVSELVALQINHLDFHNNVIRFYNKGATHKEFLMSEKLKSELKQYIDMYCNGYDFLFRPGRNRTTSILNKPLSRFKALDIFKKLALKAGITSKITSHSFRASHITHARSRGIDDKHILNTTKHHDVNMLYYYDKNSDLENSSSNHFE